MSSLDNLFPIERTELDDGTRVLRLETGGGPWFNADEARKVIADLQAAVEWVERGS